MRNAWVAWTVLACGLVASAEVLRVLRGRRDDPWSFATDQL